METHAETVEDAASAGPVLPHKALQKRCLRPGDGSQAAVQAIANAEQALDHLSVKFTDWMTVEVGNLHESRVRAKDAGFAPISLERLFSAAHDLKGHAGTLGYPLAGDICASLCRLLERRLRGARLPTELVDQHVDAVRAMLREGAKGRDHPKASVLASKLCEVTDDYLAQLNTMSAAE